MDYQSNACGTSYSKSRRRYQRGQLIRQGSCWLGRWREDVVTPGGEVKRVRRKELIGTLEELPTKRLAERELAKRLESVNHEDYRPSSSVTFGLFAAEWKKEIMIHHKPSSRSSEKSIIDVHLVPFFGEEQLRNIKAERVQQFVNASAQSPKTIKNHISLLMVMWDQVKAWEYAQHNPFPRKTNGKLMLIMPRVVKGKGYNFTIEETLAIIETAEDRWKTFFRILAETGMRPGELAGLRVCDVGPRSLRVQQSVWQQKVQTPKTENAVRTFAISAGLAAEIEWLKRGTEELLFTTEMGRPLSMDNFRNRVLEPILVELGIRAKLNRLGIKRCGNYAFRHMNMTELSRLRVPLKTIQKRVGHALGSDVTMNHYIHAVDADDLAAADAIGALFSPNNVQLEPAPYPERYTGENTGDSRHYSAASESQIRVLETRMNTDRKAPYSE